jgi:hypothetical protein
MPLRAKVSRGPQGDAMVAGVAREARAEIRKAVDALVHPDGVARALDLEPEALAPLNVWVRRVIETISRQPMKRQGLPLR